VHTHFVAGATATHSGQRRDDRLVVYISTTGIFIETVYVLLLFLFTVNI